MGKMTFGNVRGSGKFGQQGIHRSHMKAGDEFFQLRKKDVYKTSYGRFEFCPLLNLVETITS